jgi:hypothetical protein
MKRSIAFFIAFDIYTSRGDTKRSRPKATFEHGDRAGARPLEDASWKAVSNCLSFITRLKQWEKYDNKYDRSFHKIAEEPNDKNVRCYSSFGGS